MNTVCAYNVSFMNTVCIECKFYEYNVYTSQVLWIQCAYNVSFMNV